jgi:hypothetical protein
VSKTYRGWAEVEDWNIGRHFRRPHKRKSEDEARKQIKQEIEDMEQGNE